mmetsp:Transcript_15439/g.24374  ORF Transcript_15439/g.24374 Transcript_15439/m.24374 type:complete len:478 (-) Transcript_15439:198-1631(-)
MKKYTTLFGFPSSSLYFGGDGSEKKVLVVWWHGLLATISGEEGRAKSSSSTTTATLPHSPPSIYSASTTSPALLPPHRHPPPAPAPPPPSAAAIAVVAGRPVHFVLPHSLPEGLAHDGQVHGGESARGAAPRAADAPLLQHHLHLAGARRGQPHLLHQPEQVGREPHAHARELEALGEDVPAGHERQVPDLGARGVVLVKGHVARLQQLKAHLLKRLVHLPGGDHVRQPVPFLNGLLDLAVLLVLGIVLVCEAPLVAGEHAPGLQHPHDLPIHLQPVGGVARGLDGVRAVEALVREGHLHEVALHRPHPLLQPLRPVEGVAALHLVLVEGDPGDVRSSELGDVAVGAPDAATAVQQLIPGLGAQAAGEVVLVPADGLSEGLERPAVGKVETRAPAPLIKQRGQLVVGVDQGCVVAVSGLLPSFRVIMQVVVLVNPCIDIDISFLFLARESLKHGHSLGQEVLPSDCLKYPQDEVQRN